MVMMGYLPLWLAGRKFRRLFLLMEEAISVPIEGGFFMFHVKHLTDTDYLHVSRETSPLFKQKQAAPGFHQGQDKIYLIH
jgi:hypothetical protein